MRHARTTAFCAAFGIAGCSLFASLGACSLFVTLDGLNDGADASTSDVSTTDSSITDDQGVPDAADAGVIFLDDFDRPDGLLIGNGWIEKNTAAFSLTDDQVARAVTNGPDYPDNMVYRPSAEDIADSEVSIEVTFSATVIGYPQLHTRIQEDTINQAGTLDSYSIYFANDPTTAIISRTRGQEVLSNLTTFTLTDAMVPGARYRMRLRVSGQTPVSLSATVEHFNGGTWDVIGQGTALDDDPTQITSGGSVGFSGSNDDSDPYRYDNFMRTPL